jgi:hypothetical protein
MSAILKPSLLLVAAWLALGGSAAAEVAAPIAPAPKSQPDAMASILANPMIFYLAKGESDACGPGCGEWIAADGSIDSAAPQRLRALLAPLGKRKLPIFFHSPGGLGGAAMEIGRILRERGMTAGVSRTIPAGCVGASEPNCQTLKHSGQVLAAELYDFAGCNSGCVYALAGAKVRLVPPSAKLGVHSARIVQYYRDGRGKAPLPRDPSTHDKSRLDELNAQLRRYLQTMQIGAGLFEVTSKTPHEQVYLLNRDEIAAFGFDRRGFLETRWLVVEQPLQAATISKLLVEARGASQKEFRMSMIWLSCLATRRLSVTYARGLGSGENETARAIKLAIAGRTLSLPLRTSVSKIDAIDTGRSFETRTAYEPVDFFEAAATGDSVEIVETDPTDPAVSPRITKLSTAGLAKGLERFQKSCGEPPALVNTPAVVPAVKFLDMPGPGARR